MKEFKLDLTYKHYEMTGFLEKLGYDIVDETIEKERNIHGSKFEPYCENVTYAINNEGKLLLQEAFYKEIKARLLVVGDRPGWIRLLSERDMPKDEGMFYMATAKKVWEQIAHSVEELEFYYTRGLVTHYKPYDVKPPVS